MATASATITNLRIDGQTLAFTLAVTGDQGGHAELTMLVYDAAGNERERSDLGRMAVGETWEAALDLPAGSLDDGDYGAWIYAATKTADDEFGQSAEQGVSFLVGRNHIYPSSEHVDQRTSTTPPTLSPLRLEGTWIVFDMTSNETYDVEILHEFGIGIVGSGEQQVFHGTELLRAGATQQAHYLLPDDLADGRYLAVVTIQNEGSDLVAPAVAGLQVDGSVITVVPA
ncbi:MAG: hypothetical protein ABI949_18525 [Ilumatobacteraceae bacterium]